MENLILLVTTKPGIVSPVFYFNITMLTIRSKISNISISIMGPIRASTCDSPRKPLLPTAPPNVQNAAEPNSQRESIMEGHSGVEINESDAKELPRKKNTGLIRLLGAPVMDIVEAKKMAMEDEAFEGHNIVDPEDPETPRTNQGDESEYLDAANEETFTLETFESLVRAARSTGKAFILARVTTVDPSNLTRLYFSYYAAHHINRVIFRTQPEEGLLHRMKSRNPLNNMLIVGDVHYFAVTPEEFDRAWADRQFRKEQQKVLRSSVGHSDTNLKSTLMRAVSQSHRRSVSETIQFGRFGIFNHSSTSLPEVSQARLPPTEIDLSQLDDDDPTIPVIYEAAYFGTDDDFLMRGDIREYFKANSVNPDDYQLFQLHRRDLPYDLTVLGPDGTPLARGTNPTNTRRQRMRLRNAWGLLDDGNHKSMICGLHLGYLSPIGFWLSMLLLTAGTVFMALVFIPAPFHYFAFAGLVVLFAIVLLVFVNWEDNPEA